jgi:hypothetical protein
MNAVVRETFKFQNPFYLDGTSCFGPGHVNDFDTRYTMQILIDYLEKFIVLNCNEAIVNKLYQMIMERIFHRDEIIFLRSGEVKSTAERFYHRKGYTNSLLFDIFDPSKPGTPSTCSIVCISVEKNKLVVGVDKKNIFIPLSNKVLGKEEYIQKIQSICSVNYSEKIFCLMSPTHLLMIVPVDKINDSLDKIDYFEFVHKKVGIDWVPHMKTLKYYGIKPFSYLIE